MSGGRAVTRGGAARQRAAFTLPEALVAGALFLVIAASFFFAWSGSRREEELASLHLSMLENASLAMMQLRNDLREMVVLSYTAVEGISLKTAQSPSGIMLRQGGLTRQTGGAFMLVEYRLVDAPSKSGAPRFHLQRTRRTSDGSPLPFGGKTRDTTVFTQFTLADAYFAYLPPRLKPNDPHGDDHVVHVSFTVVSDTGRAGSDTYGEKSMLLTQVMRFLKPPDPRNFGMVLEVPGLEQLPGDAVSSALGAPAPLPAFEDGAS